MFLAEHTKLKAYRAVKCIYKTHPAQPQFFLEADILKNLKHPGIPTIYDVEEDNDAYYIIEEYIQGQSLEAFVLHQDCISTDVVIHIVLQICEVLCYLHSQQPHPIIYQDLKPEHIILCGERIVLLDFGIASYITSSGNTFQSFGTEGYAPPEKYQNLACDVRTDVYGVGKILEFLGKKAPSEKFQFLRPLLQKALAYSMEERYPTVRAFADDLERAECSGRQNTQQTQNKHLLTDKKIAIAGTQERVGVTHVAIALTCFFNHQNRPCIYQEHHPSDCMRLLAREAGSLMKSDGVVARGYFRGIPYYGEGIERQEERDSLYISDYGRQIQDILELEEDRKLILVTGSRPWENQHTERLLSRLSFRSNLALICNYGNSIQAREMARAYHHRVYCFPLDEDPFQMTRVKRRLFQKLLKQEGW